MDMGTYLSIILLFIITVAFAGCGDKKPSAELAPLKSRLNTIEKRLAQLEETEKKLSRIEGPMRQIQESLKQLNESYAELRRPSSGVGEEKTSAKNNRYHVVRSGESLSLIALRYNTTVEDLCWLNKITPKTVIRPGQKLIVELAVE